VVVPVGAELATATASRRALRRRRLSPPESHRLASGRRRRDRLAYVKASEGGDFVDRRFGENWRAAGEAGLDRGAYHFFSLCTPGLVQARNFLAVASPDPVALAPAVDLELAGNCGERPDAAVVHTELDAFLRQVEDAWRTEVVLYVGDDFEARYGVRRGVVRPLWHRRFLLRPDVDDWQIWQVHGYAHVDGVSGRVDLDLRRPVA